jgi:hypothetical protein
MIQWEKLESDYGVAHRAKVPGGWLVVFGFSGDSVTFYPDPQHTWDGSSLP